MTLCLLYELDATISVIQNMGTICANICFIHNIGGRHVCKSVKKMVQKLKGRRPNAGHRWGSCQGQTELDLFPICRPPHYVWTKIDRLRSKTQSTVEDGLT
jgi:hypothetical protein